MKKKNNCLDCLYMKAKIPILEGGYLDYETALAHCAKDYILTHDGTKRYFKGLVERCRTKDVRNQQAFVDNAKKCEDFTSMDDKCIIVS